RGRAPGEGARSADHAPPPPGQGDRPPRGGPPAGRGGSAREGARHRARARAPPVSARGAGAGLARDGAPDPRRVAGALRGAAEDDETELGIAVPKPPSHGETPAWGVGGAEAAIALADRFATLLDAGRRIVTALDREAVFAAVEDASKTLLRGERVSIIDRIPE